MTDVNNCGACNHQCAFPFANASCDNGVCTQGACLANFYDRDPNVPGCETECIKTNGGVEICDGLDNDCDGVVDDNLAAATITCLTKGVCAGTPADLLGAERLGLQLPGDLSDHRGHLEGLRHARQRLQRPDRRAVPDRQGLHLRHRALRGHRHLGLRQHDGRRPPLHGVAEAAGRRDLRRHRQRLRRPGRRARLGVEPDHRRRAGLHRRRRTSRCTPTRRAATTPPRRAPGSTRPAAAAPSPARCPGPT